MKFGGTSVGNAERMRSVVALVCEALAAPAGDRVLVVASAVAGVTNLLVDGARTAAEAGSIGDIGSISARFRAVHRGIVEELGSPDEVAGELDGLAAELDNLLQGVALLQE